MKLEEIKPKQPLAKKKRVGRGEGSGKGKTAGRGQKGQKSRSGVSGLLRREGGQTPLLLRLPKKRGFRRPKRRDFQIVNVGVLNKFKDGAKIDLVVLEKEGLIKSAEFPCKVLGEGQLERKLEITATAFSKSALLKIKKAKGKAIFLKGTLSVPKRELSFLK